MSYPELPTVGLSELPMICQQRQSRKIDVDHLPIYVDPNRAVKGVAFQTISRVPAAPPLREELLPASHSLERLPSFKPQDNDNEEEDLLEKAHKQLSSIFQGIEERRKQEEDHFQMSTPVDELLSGVFQASSLDPNAAVSHDATASLQPSQQPSNPTDIGLIADLIKVKVRLKKDIELEIGQVKFWRNEYCIKIEQIDPNALLSHEKSASPASPLATESEVTLESQDQALKLEPNEIEQLQLKLLQLRAQSKHWFNLYNKAKELAKSNPKPQPNTSELQSMITQLHKDVQIQVEHIGFWQEQYRKKQEYRKKNDKQFKVQTDALLEFPALSLPKPIPELELNGLSQRELVEIKLEHERYLEQLKKIRIFWYKQYQNLQMPLTVNENTSPVTDTESQTSELMSIITKLHEKTNFQIKQIKFWQTQYRKEYGSFKPADIPEELMSSLSLEPDTQVDLSGLSKEQLVAVKLQHERTLEQLEMLRIFWFEISKTRKVPINQPTTTLVENSNLPVNNKIVENSNLPVNNKSTVLKIISALFAAGIFMCFYVYIPYYLKQIKV